VCNQERSCVEFDVSDGSRDLPLNTSKVDVSALWRMSQRSGVMSEDLSLLRRKAPALKQGIHLEYDSATNITTQMLYY